MLAEFRASSLANEQIEDDCTRIHFLRLLLDLMKAENNHCDAGTLRGVGGTVACESALRSAGTLLSRVRAPSSAPRPDGVPESKNLVVDWLYTKTHRKFEICYSFFSI
ncbi:hypothetical protein PoB_004725100 [Plakobranchus ocellatus]|uniref:Uncharacterized protein n=1 Tax=Plakobranchus ocellatus TaxID=259542 RepID=A0AAV4BP05_9GAST|nr:hypothetical protein PoB_004725100 [Plakobranchus ocellatus]